MQFHRLLRGRPGTMAVALLVAVPTIVPNAARANSYKLAVSNVQLQQSALCGGQPLTISYALGGWGYTLPGLVNVKIEILNGATVVKTVTLTPPAAGTQRGQNTVTVPSSGIPSGGPYTVRVTATPAQTSVTNAAFTRVSDPADPATHFYDPRGVDVNRNPGSPYFGRIYVSEGAGGDTGGRFTRQGIYILNPDLSDAFPGSQPRVQDSGANGGAWGPTANSPHRVTVGPDDNIYIADWSEAHSGLFIADPNGENVKDLLIFPNPPGGTRAPATGGAGLVLDAQGREIYSSTSGVYVEGIGANRKIYLADYYMYPMGSVWRHDIPAGTVQWGEPPTMVIENTGFINPTDSEHDITKDSQGNYYVMNATGTDEGYKFNSSGSQVARLITGAPGYRGITIDEARNRVVVGTTDGRVFLTNKEFQSPTAIATGLGGNVRDVAFDADGWLYVVDSTDSRLYLYAPPGTHAVDAGTATAAQPLTLSSGPLPGDIAPVGPSGINTGPNGQKYGDGKVDLQDAVYSLRVHAGLNAIP